MEPSSDTLPDGFTTDDGAMFHGAEAVQAMLQQGLEKQERRRRALERMTPLERYRLARWYAAGRPPMPPQRPVATHTPNARAREHRPAATRRSSSGSRSSGADPGDLDADPEPASDPGIREIINDLEVAGETGQLELRGVCIGCSRIAARLDDLLCPRCWVKVRNGERVPLRATWTSRGRTS